jgi:hypothetical protein
LAKPAASDASIKGASVSAAVAFQKWLPRDCLSFMFRASLVMTGRLQNAWLGSNNANFEAWFYGSEKLSIVKLSIHIVAAKVYVRS